ncbi:MAG: flagellar basal body rod protein FlgC [Planctomycetota bacterium]|jgi:flagellar basal-body rod protein FlgC
MQVDNTFGPVDIAISGLRAQRKQIDVISSNVANARTTDAGKGEPYRRREAVFKTEDDEISGVSLDRIVTDQSGFYRIFDPGNPNADEGGYVAMPNVNLPTEMINLTIATRTYQANAAILRRYQQMIETTLELLR